MPVQRVDDYEGKPGYRYGDTGKVYTYEPGDKASRKRAYAKARRQGVAIEISRHKEG